MEALKVDIVSPSGQLVANKAVNVLRVPSMEGEITILPGHIDMVSLLGTGCLRLDNEITYVVYKGIMEISGGNTVVIAAERTAKTSDLDKQTVLNSIKAVEEKLSKEQLDDKEFEKVSQEYKDHLAELRALN
jgi:F-type H+-transporting ATPase subunit epsilon